jgi:hypothetical protein
MATEHVRPDEPETQLADVSATDGIEAEIRCEAHELYVLRGGTHGGDVADWLEAERLVRFRRNPNGGHAPHLLES